MTGDEHLVLTGQLGDVMKESAQAALSYLRSQEKSFGCRADFTTKKEIHVHLPEGAIPKDGPSAGITMAILDLSAVTNRPARGDVAMTGEITLRGKVLASAGSTRSSSPPSGAASRRSSSREENVKDLDDLPEEIRSVLEFHLVDDVDEVVRLALEGAPVAAPPKPVPAEAGAAPPSTLGALTPPAGPGGVARGVRSFSITRYRPRNETPFPARPRPRRAVSVRSPLGKSVRLELPAHSAGERPRGLPIPPSPSSAARTSASRAS